jgi:hypothetical protein
MIFVSKEKARESRERRSKKRRELKRKRGEELVKNYVYKGDK